MKERKRLTLHNLIVFIPIVIIIVIIIISQCIFESDHNQTYERIKEQKLIQTQMLARQIDEVLDFSGTKEMEQDHIMMIKSAIEDMNVKDGVFTYLVDENFNLISNRDSKYYKNRTSDEILAALHGNKDFQEDIKTNDDPEYIKVNIDGDEFDFYWEKIPSGKEDVQYYVICGISKNMISSNAAMVTCKCFIGLLNTLLMIIMYRNIYLVRELEETKTKK